MLNQILQDLSHTRKKYWLFPE